ncbi:pyridoxamine 5'-phosphate oxidase family protein [Dermatophilus congolensis]|uniref:pyridoxamine 5'-phosphate oxidase family protein n=1 Tax=Dermatophilus congolensis TaxID=1863 RepID=UPI001AAF50BB|nr:pyridoxamine 5'-phosphate oxidase family protein [Dermatophilus congolensis]MBO3128581.1 pyridoxamine 5'-phosphate oxidase family protein [Dermatophilus congolensis]MBO3132782.1 pyridoxamine 5'-phosphate oxidase family protein [Dermatophilus congolensis]MBO3133059.1 pyridoxamine 5'-phosphate oxidase family protein [Dermatophilus congolensis]MBO3135291.1 pyridoxamine 5'-phosphate oxidase family protein [Dermatophilus congolensis]MBO3137534.1 pyridoxamine 5'-phosphate oxidase family protein [
MWRPLVEEEIGIAQRQAKVAELIRNTRVAMMTMVDKSGGLVSIPMATQEAEVNGTFWFITEKNSAKVRHLSTNPRVNLAFAGSGSWVSVSGTARILNDPEKLKELWGTFTDAWLKDGPENPDNVLLRVDAETAEYWDSSGSGMIVQLANLVKSAVTGERMEGENEVVRFSAKEETHHNSNS